MSYMPPHSRNNGGRKPSWKVEEEKKENNRLSKLVTTESNFPALPSGYAKAPTTWGGQKSFALLASEWKNKGDEEKEAMERDRLRQVRISTNIETPRFYRMQPIEEDTYNNIDSIDRPENAEEEWTLISKKVRVAKEITHEQLDKEYAEIEQGNDNANMWNDQPRDHETYWDERRT